MPNPYSGIEKSVDKVAGAISALRKSEEQAQRKSGREARRTSVDVNLLTSAEVEELRLLISNEPSLQSFARARIDDGGPVIEGMYAELDRLGLIETIGGVPIVVHPLAHWAVEKRAQLDAERERQRSKDRTREILLAVATTAVGGLLAIAGSVVGALIGK